MHFSPRIPVAEGALIGKPSVHSKGGAHGFLLFTWSQWLPRFHMASSFKRGARGFHVYTQMCGPT